MRTYGRIVDQPSGAKFWVEVTEDPKGFRDAIYTTALIQTLKLNYNESPFYADWGIPAHSSVVQQVAPDFYVTLTQQRYAPYFLSLIITKTATSPPNSPPTYAASVIFHNGATDILTIPIALVDGYGIPITDGFGNIIQIGSRTGAAIAQ